LGHEGQPTTVQLCTSEVHTSASSSRDETVGTLFRLAVLVTFHGIPHSLAQVN
jgi:hypothetical protein